MAQVNSLNELFHEELQILLSGEEQLIEALPTMADAANSEELQRAFEEHLEQTQQHAEKLRTLLGDLGAEVEAKFCPAMAGIIKAGDSRARLDAPENVRDAALIVAAQRVEHFEIAGYGSARTFAALLGHDAAANVLEEIEEEEAQTDKTLTKLSEKLNEQAMAEDTTHTHKTST